MAASERVVFDWNSAKLECDVVMKGGITSGVIYPRALTEFAKTYRFRGVGGASAGAIGAAFAAAAEFGRDSGGFERLEEIPDLLGNGKLGRLFQPQPSTAALMPILLSATAPHPGGVGGKVRAVLASVRRQFALAGALGALWGALIMIVAVLIALALVPSNPILGILAGLVILISGALLVVIGWLVAVVLRVFDKLTQAVPENLFGICRGLSTGGGEEGLTDWLSDRIDALAGLTPGSGPLTFGQLWGASNPTAAETDASLRKIDLLMVSTCLSRTRPYEMPWEARNFFYSPAIWATLFPSYVMAALEASSEVASADLSGKDAAEWNWISERARAQGLRRLPSPADLPVIVATRMSLSFPLLISAIPMKSIDFRSNQTRAALQAHRAEKPSDADLEFETLWFTDGGLCSNFPISMFDSPLPTRPTFGINLGKLPEGVAPSTDQSKNIDWAKNNNEGLLPPYRAIAENGIEAVGDFALAALDAARNWQDNSYLDVPGYRDRIVRVLQSEDEGGLNLNMDSTTITGLGERGRKAASTLVNQFGTPNYANGATGWQNHRWVRYRALLAAMPDFLRGYRNGHEALDVASPPSYPLNAAASALGDTISSEIYSAAAAVGAATPAVLDELKGIPRAGRIRRVPEI